tara:strand:+ start:9023 stop:9646 length:624 start_codon:yes stop_codon:yes gene_type:complete
MVLYLSLVACTQLDLQTPVTAEDPGMLWQHRQESLNKFVDWDISGRLAFRMESRSGSSSLIWKHNEHEQRIQLLGPLGGGQINIYDGSDGVLLEDGTGKIFRGRSADEVFLSALSLSVPFAQLSYWVRGLPAPGVHNGIGLDRLGRVRNLTQDGWLIEYQEYQSFSNMELPRKIVVSSLPALNLPNDDKSNKSIHLKLVIGKWGPNA